MARVVVEAKLQNRTARERLTVWIGVEKGPR